MRSRGILKIHLASVLLGVVLMTAVPVAGAMSDALRALPGQALPSRSAAQGLLDGLTTIVDRCGAWFGRAAARG